MGSDIIITVFLSRIQNPKTKIVGFLLGPSAYANGFRPATADKLRSLRETAFAALEETAPSLWSRLSSAALCVRDLIFTAFCVLRPAY